MEREQPTPNLPAKSDMSDMDMDLYFCGLALECTNRNAAVVTPHDVLSMNGCPGVSCNAVIVKQVHPLRALFEDRCTVRWYVLSFGNPHKLVWEKSGHRPIGNVSFST